MRLANATDHALLLHWQNHGDPAAFAALVDRHAAMVHSASMRVVRNRALAQEVAQDSFLKLTQLERFDGESLGGWLHRVATNRALDIAKSESRRHTRETAYEESRETPAPSSESIAVLAEIDAALSALPDDLRELVVLHYLEGATHKEIARRTSISRATVTRSIHRALDQLREHLGARGVSATAAAILASLESAKSTAAPAALIVALRKLALQHPAGASAAAPLIPIRAAATALAIAAVVVTSIFGLRFLRSIDNANGDPTTHVASAEQQAPAPVTPETLPPVTTPSPESTPHSIQLAASPSLTQEQPTTTLRCVDSDGNPVPDAEVYFVRIETKPFVAAPEEMPKQISGPFTSDPDGGVAVPAIDGRPEYSWLYYQAFARVSGKLVGLWMHHPGFPKRDNWDEIALTPSYKLAGTVTVPHGFDVRAVTVRLLSLNARAGRAGGSFANATKYEESTIPPLAAQHPDAQGKFYFNDLPSTGGVYLAANAPGLAESQAYGFDQAQIQNPTLNMVTESQLFGTLRYSPSQAPVVGAVLFAHPRGGPTSGIGVISPFITRTDQSGHFRFTSLPAEVFNVMVRPESDWVASVVTGIRVNGQEQQGPVDLTFEHGGIAEGFVRDAATKAPIANADLCAVNPDDPNWSVQIAFTSTDADGHYQVRLPTGSSRLYFSKVPSGYAYPGDEGKKNATIKADQRESLKIDFTLSAGEAYKDPGKATVTGRAINALGQPQQDVPVYDDAVTGSRGSQMTYGLVGRTDSKGMFRIAIGAIGKHKLVLGGGGGMAGKSDIVHFSRVKTRELSPKKDETYDLGDSVVTEYKESIGGTVVDDQGNPVSGIFVWLLSDIPGCAEMSQTTDNAGAFTFKYLPKGRFRLIADPNMFIRPDKEAPSPFDKTTIEGESGFDYEIVLKRKTTPQPEKP